MSDGVVDGGPVTLAAKSASVPLLVLSTGETIVEAYRRLRGHGIHSNDIYATARVVHSRKPKKGRDWGSSIIDVLESMGADDYPLLMGTGSPECTSQTTRGRAVSKADRALLKMAKEM